MNVNIVFFFFQARDGIRDLVRSRGLGDVYKRQVVHRTHVIEAVGVRNELMIRAFFSQLFYTAVEKAHHRGRFDQPLAFQLEDDFQHAVRAGVLRPHIEEQLFRSQGWKRRVFRMFRIDFIDCSSLIFELCHERLVVQNGRPTGSARPKIQTYRAILCRGAESLCVGGSLLHTRPASECDEGRDGSETGFPSCRTLRAP